MEVKRGQHHSFFSRTLSNSRTKKTRRVDRDGKCRFPPQYCLPTSTPESRRESPNNSQHSPTIPETWTTPPLLDPTRRARQKCKSPSGLHLLGRIPSVHMNNQHSWLHNHHHLNNITVHYNNQHYRNVVCPSPIPPPYFFG